MSIVLILAFLIFLKPDIDNKLSYKKKKDLDIDLKELTLIKC